MVLIGAYSRKSIFTPGKNDTDRLAAREKPSGQGGSDGGAPFRETVGCLDVMARAASPKPFPPQKRELTPAPDAGLLTAWGGLILGGWW